MVNSRTSRWFLTFRQSFPTFLDPTFLGDVAKWLRRRIANPLFVGSNPTVASRGWSRNFPIEEAFTPLYRHFDV